MDAPLDHATPRHEAVPRPAQLGLDWADTPELIGTAAASASGAETAHPLDRLQRSSLAFVSAFQRLEHAWNALGAVTSPPAEAGEMFLWSSRHQPGGQRLPDLPRPELVALQRSAEAWRHALRDAGAYLDARRDDDPWSDAMRATGFTLMEQLFWLIDVEAWHPEGRGGTADGLRARFGLPDVPRGAEEPTASSSASRPQPGMLTWPLRHLHRLADAIALPKLWEDAGRALVVPLVHTRADVRWWIRHRGRDGSLTPHELSWLLGRPDVGTAEWSMLLLRTGPALPALDTVRDVLHRISSADPAALKQSRALGARGPAIAPLVLRTPDGVAWWVAHCSAALTLQRALPDGQEFWLQGAERLLPWLPSDARAALWSDFSQRAPERTLRVLARTEWPSPLTLDDLRQLLRTPVRSVREAAMRALAHVDAGVSPSPPAPKRSR